MLLPLGNASGLNRLTKAKDQAIEQIDLRRSVDSDCRHVWIRVTDRKGAVVALGDDNLTCTCRDRMCV